MVLCQCMWKHRGACLVFTCTDLRWYFGFCKFIYVPIISVTAVPSILMLWWKRSSWGDNPVKCLCLFMLFNIYIYICVCVCVCLYQYFVIQCRRLWNWKKEEMKPSVRCSQMRTTPTTISLYAQLMCHGIPDLGSLSKWGRGTETLLWSKCAFFFVFQWKTKLYKHQMKPKKEDSSEASYNAF